MHKPSKAFKAKEYIYEIPSYLGAIISPNTFDETYETDTSSSDDQHSYYSDDPISSEFYASLVKHCTLEELNMICDDNISNCSSMKFCTDNNSNNNNLETIKTEPKENELDKEDLNFRCERSNNPHEVDYYNEFIYRNSQRTSVIKLRSAVAGPPMQIGKRSYKLWEFLRNLLLDSRTCPSLIKWEDYCEGSFKFVQSEKVAQLWGQRKKNHKMTYEKLSRAMRYYYRSKVLLPVVGKRLVYKFGPFATGWRTNNPIL